MYFLWHYQRRLSHIRSKHAPPRAKFFLPGPSAQTTPAILGATGAAKPRRAGAGQPQQVVPQPAPFDKPASEGDRLGVTFSPLASLGSDACSSPSPRPPNPAAPLLGPPPAARQPLSPEPGRASAMPAPAAVRRPSCRARARLAQAPPPREPCPSARRRSAGRERESGAEHEAGGEGRSRGRGWAVARARSPKRGPPRRARVRACVALCLLQSHCSSGPKEPGIGNLV